MNDWKLLCTMVSISTLLTYAVNSIFNEPNPSNYFIVLATCLVCKIGNDNNGK